MVVTIKICIDLPYQNMSKGRKISWEFSTLSWICEPLKWWPQNRKMGVVCFVSAGSHQPVHRPLTSSYENIKELGQRTCTKLPILNLLVLSWKLWVFRKFSWYQNQRFCDSDFLIQNWGPEVLWFLVFKLRKTLKAEVISKIRELHNTGDNPTLI